MNRWVVTRLSTPAGEMPCSRASVAGGISGYQAQLPEGTDDGVDRDTPDRDARGDCVPVFDGEHAGCGLTPNSLPGNAL
jgi:hypothetical protein